MQWALVNNIPMELSQWIFDDVQQQQIWTTSEAPANTVMNIIVYDGIAEYNPEEDLRLMQIDDGIKVGDLLT